jgi:uridine kinase
MNDRPVPAPSDPLAGFAAHLRALPPSCGPVRIVAVDGHAGSGKTTYAARLAAALGGAPVVHLDDLATHDELFGWTGRLREQVLEPLAAGRAARHGVYDWTRRRFDGVREVPAAPVVLLEGVGSGRSALRPLLSHLLWLEVPRDTARDRGQLRDGPGMDAFWSSWMRAQDAHFVSDPSQPFADHLVLLRPEGYEMPAGPGRCPSTP